MNTESSLGRFISFQKSNEKKRMTKNFYVLKTKSITHTVAVIKKYLRTKFMNVFINVQFLKLLKN